MTAADQNVRVFVMIDPLPTSPNTQNVQVALARGICHLFVDRLPEAALPEVVESLKMMFEFYAATRRPVGALPEPRRVLAAKVTGRQERRPLSFDRD
jgi:hypothetical protein